MAKPQCLIIPGDVAEDPRLSVLGKAVFAYFHAYFTSPDVEFPTPHDIANYLNAPLFDVQAAISLLDMLGFIKMHYGLDGQGQQQVNSYTCPWMHRNDRFTLYDDEPAEAAPNHR